MKFNFLTHFRRKADDGLAKLADAEDPNAVEVDAMSELIRKAYGTNGISVADKLPDDSHTAVSAAVAEHALHRDPEMAARMAWSNPALG